MDSAAPPRLPPVTLVIGGARSGKSTYAEKLATGALHGRGSRPALYIATADAAKSAELGDVEMAARILAHKARRGPLWTTVEAPAALAEAIAANAELGRPILVDCLTLWLTNLLLDDADVDHETDRLVEALDADGAGLPCPVLFVANEVGLGIVPDNALARRFRDAAGRLNMRMAARADRMVLLTAGIPMVLKDRPAG